MGRAPTAAHDRRNQIRLVLDQIGARHADFPLEVRQVGIVEARRPNVEQTFLLANGEIGLHRDAGVDLACFHDFDDPRITFQ